MNEDVPHPAGDGDGLQFDRADFSGAAVAGAACASCKQPIIDAYFDINGGAYCRDCHQKFAAALAGGSPFVRAVAATLAGSVAGLVGAGIYFGVAALTGYEIGLIALVVGFLVGIAVRWGAAGRGGWFYQLLAVGLTYLAIGASYTASVVKAYADDPAAFESAIESQEESGSDQTNGDASGLSPTSGGA